MPRRHADERGSIAVMVAASMVLFLGLAALVVDLGLARDRHRTAQNAADAAALAAAGALAAAAAPGSVTATDVARARAVADGYVVANGWPTGIATFGVDPAGRTVTIDLVPEQTPTAFAGMIGASTPAVSASAQATWAGPAPGCAICVLGDVVSRNGQLTATAGSVLIGGALDLRPQGAVTAQGVVGVAGQATVGGTVTPAVTPIAGVTDPYRDAPPLPPSGPPALGLPATSAPGPACGPGTYTSISNCRTFARGLYVVTGVSRFSGNITVDASSGVVFYATCSQGRATVISSACAQGQAGGSIQFAGTVDGTITALPDPAFRGLAIIYDRNNTAPLVLVGAPGLTVDGGVYAASARLTNNGTGPLTVNGTLVVGSILLDGVPSRIVVTGPDVSTPAGDRRVHLTR